MPHKNISIPKDKQLEYLSQGLSEFYKLLESYVGDLNNSGDVRIYVTITKKELASYLIERPYLMKKHLFIEGSPQFHEQPILEYHKRKYLVYEISHGDPWNIKEYEDFAEATAEYLMYNLEPPIQMPQEL